MSTIKLFLDDKTLTYNFNLASTQGLVFSRPTVTSNSFSLITGAFKEVLTGSFIVNADATISGAISSYTAYYNNNALITISNLLVNAHDYWNFASSGQVDQAAELITKEINNYIGSDYNDDIKTKDISSTVSGGAGNDVIVGGAGADYLRGDDGNDSITGGAGFDDINGNKGNDTASGGEGNDWVVGGQDNDLLSGDNGNDIVYGNLGNDTCYGGNGNDWVRGGQGDDVIYGDAGNDFMSGDKGNDTIYGGAGADRFNMVAGCGTDKVMDFKASEGDYVTIEGNPSAYHWFVGSDCYISTSPPGGVDVMILVGVSSDALLGSHWYIAS